MKTSNTKLRWATPDDTAVDTSRRGNLGRQRAALLLVVSLCASPAFSQQAGANTSSATSRDAGEETIVLSPFVVDASKDTGYRATSTLAGTRIATDLRDVAASITEITPEFLKDVAAVNINDVLVYTAGTESTVNFTDAPAQGIGGFADRASNNSQTANRVRGLNAATLTRDYFISIGNNIGFDSYNVDRISINRGPNSILFGLGDPSGIVNYAPKLAKLAENRNEVSFRYGSDSDMRATADFNRVLLPGKLALRLNALWSDQGFQQQPAYFKDKRLNLALTAKPFEKTTLYLGYEKVKQNQNNPNTITPLDNVTSWIAAGRPTWNPSTQAWATRPAGFGSITAGGQLAPTRPDGSMELVFPEASGTRQFAGYFQPNTPGVLIFNTLAVSDSRYLPLHSMNLNDSVRNNELDTFTATWDQQIVKGLFFNVAYLREDLENDSKNWIRSNGYAVNIDVNTHYPDGTPNPHFGETYMAQGSLDSKGEFANSNEAIRGTLSYDLNFTTDTGWKKWLGRHVFTGYSEHRETKSEFNGYNGIQGGTPSYLPSSNRINNNAWQVTRLRYFGGTDSKQGIYAPGIPPTEVTGVPHRYFDTASGTFRNDTFDEIYALKRNDLNNTTVKSNAAVWQGYFLNGRLVGTFGMRRDENTVRTRSSTSIDPASGNLIVNRTLGDPSTVSGHTKTYGLVAHPLKWLSFHYNKSENFIPVAGDVNIFGELFPPPSGKGKDYGFSVDLFEGKLNAKVNWYELDSTNSRTTNSGPDILAQWELPFFSQVVIPALAAQAGVAPPAAFTPLTWGDNRIQETADQVSKGIELELTYNPTKNWRIMATLSKNEASQSNIAPSLTRWVQEVLPQWQSQPWFSGPYAYDSGWGFNGNLQGYINTFNTGRVLPTYKALEGQTSQELRKYHFSLISNYQFTEGRFKGWNFGGAVRWQSEAAIGYPALTNSAGQLVGLDLDNAYTDGGDIFADVWTGYSKRILHDRVNWNIQLNVRNLTGSDKLRPILKNSDGTPSQFRIEFGPTWYLSNTFSF